MLWNAERRVAEDAGVAGGGVAALSSREGQPKTSMFKMAQTGT